MKKKGKCTNIKDIYKSYLSHDACTITNKKSKKLLSYRYIFSFVLLIFILLVYIFKESAFLRMFIMNSVYVYIPFYIFLLYFFLFTLSLNVYNTISYTFEKRNKHELLRKDITGFSLIFYIILLVILFPYVFLTFLLTKTLNILKIEDLKDYLFSIIPMYISFIYMGVLFILVEMYVLHNILSKYPSIITNRINLKTYIYIIIFLTIIFFRKLFNYSIKKIITLTTPKNSNQYKLLIKQLHLLNAYFLISITFIFKSLNFSVYENIFVDALFYSISILTLLDNAHSLAQHL